MRRRLVCRMAARLPQTIDSSGSTTTSSSIGEASTASPNNRTVASSTAALTITAIYAVTGTLAAS